MSESDEVAKQIITAFSALRKRVERDVATTLALFREAGKVYRINRDATKPSGS